MPMNLSEEAWRWKRKLADPHGAGRLSSLWLESAALWAWGTSGGSRTCATGAVEVRHRPFNYVPHHLQKVPWYYHVFFLQLVCWFWSVTSQLVPKTALRPAQLTVQPALCLVRRCFFSYD